MQQLKREIKSAVIQRLVETKVLVLPARVEEESLGANVQVPLLGEEERSGDAVVEGSGAKASLLPFEPFSPTSMRSGGDARLKVRLARVQMEAHEKAEERQAEMKLRLKVRKLEIEADKQIRLRKLELNAAKNVPASFVPPLQIAGAPFGPGSPVTTFDVSKHISLVPQFRETEVDSYFSAFESIASALNWSKEVWPLLLQCKLTGKVQEVCAALSLENSLNYDMVKVAIGVRECLPVKGVELILGNDLAGGRVFPVL